MVEEYVREQRAWLGQLYPKHRDRLVVPPTERVLDPQSPQWHIVQIFQDLLESRIGGEEAAQGLADVILPSKDTETLYNPSGVASLTPSNRSRMFRLLQLYQIFWPV